MAEFRYGGEVIAPMGIGGSAERSLPQASNLPGRQKERWFHRLGCRRWLVAQRDIRTNEVFSTEWLAGEE